MRTLAALRSLLSGLAWLAEFFGQLGDEVTFVKPDNAPRYGTLCRCGECGVTQMVELVRNCVNCGAKILTDEHRGQIYESDVIVTTDGSKHILHMNVPVKMERW